MSSFLTLDTSLSGISAFSPDASFPSSIILHFALAALVSKKYTHRISSNPFLIFTKEQPFRLLSTITYFICSLFLSL